MKKKKRILSAILGIVIAASMFPLGASAAASGSLKSDTTAPFNVGMGKNYTFKITASGTSQKPVVTVANGSALKVFFKGQQGNNYFYTVTAIGQEGSTSGVYMALPGQSAIRCCIVTVGTPTNQQPSQQTLSTKNLADLEYFTEQNDVEGELQYYNLDGNGGSDRDTSNADVNYKTGLGVWWNGASKSDGDGSIYRDYLINGQYNQFKGVFALTQYSRNWTEGQFALNIYGDNKLLYSSDAATAGVLPQEFSVNIANVKMLRVETTIESLDGHNKVAARAAIYNAQLVK